MSRAAQQHLKGTAAPLTQLTLPASASLSGPLRTRGSPRGSDGEELPARRETLDLIPGWGRSPGEGIGCPLQDSWASLVAQMLKNPPAMRETWVWSLGGEEPLEKGVAAHSRILAWRIPWTQEPGGLSD